MLPVAIDELSEKFQIFPGVGKRSGQKLALDLLEMDTAKYDEFIYALEQVKKEIIFCDQCNYFASANSAGRLCPICSDAGRNNSQLCLVEKPTDVLTIEKSQIFRGRYHVIGKLISPLDNVFAENTDISKLVTGRIPEMQKNSRNLELILFFRAGFAADTTTAYIKELLKKASLIKNIKITKLAQGLPLYYNPDTLDQATMVQALEDRREIK